MLDTISDLSVWMLMTPYSFSSMVLTTQGSTPHSLQVRNSATFEENR